MPVKSLDCIVRYDLCQTWLHVWVLVFGEGKNVAIWGDKCMEGCKMYVLSKLE